MNRTSAIIWLAGLALTGCQQLGFGGAATPAEPAIPAGPVDPVQTAPEPEASVEPADLPPIVSLNSETFSGTVNLPEGLAAIAPDLEARLRREAEDDLVWMQAEADAYKAADPDFFRPYTYGKTWTLLHAANGLVSLKASGSQYTGGAHANHFITGLVHDTRANLDIDVMNLFADREAAGVRLTSLVRAAILEQKREKYAGTAISEADLVADVESGVSDRLGWARQSALIPAGDSAGFGGIDFYFSPYELGAYAEGSYIARIPQSALRDLFNPDDLPMFTGDPAIPD